MAQEKQPERPDLVKVAPGKTVTRAHAEDVGLVDDKGKPADAPALATENVVAGDGKRSIAGIAAATGQSTAAVRNEAAREQAKHGGEPGEPKRETSKLDGSTAFEGSEEARLDAVVGSAAPGRMAPGEVQAVLDDALVRGIIEKPMDASGIKSAAIREDHDGTRTLFFIREGADKVETATVIEPLG